MATNFSDSTPAAPAGGSNVKWQKDGSGNVSAYILGGSGGAGGVNTQTANYNVAATDTGKLIDCNSSSAFTVTLLGTAPTNTSWYIVVHNRGTGAVTISRNGLTIDGKSQNLVLYQGDAVAVYTDGTNYFTGSPRSGSLGIFVPGTMSNNQVLLYLKLDRPTIFPASAPNSLAVAKTAATGSTTVTLSKNGSSFATTVWSGSGTVGAWTQASDATFAAGDILEIDGPATADATLANVGITLQGYRF